jgi:hypothetical protein
LHPLVDSERFRRHIEAAYLAAWEICQRGNSPRSFRSDAVFDRRAGVIVVVGTLAVSRALT